MSLPSLADSIRFSPQIRDIGWLNYDHLGKVITVSVTYIELSNEPPLFFPIDLPLFGPLDNRQPHLFLSDQILKNASYHGVI